MTAAEKVRVLVVDDDKLIREGWRLILEATGDFELVATATRGSEVEALIENQGVDVVLMDLIVGGVYAGGESENAIRTIKTNRPNTIVVAMTGYAAMVQGALSAGADVAFLKGAVADYTVVLESIRDLIVDKSGARGTNGA